MNKCFLLALIFFTVGCTTTGQPYSPPPPAPQGKALIYFMRTSVWYGNGWPTVFSVNNTKIVSLYDDGYSWIHLDSGSYKFSAGNVMHPNYLEFTMPIEAGREYILEYGQTSSFQAHRDVFESVSVDDRKSSVLEFQKYKEADKVEIPRKP